MKYVPPFCHRRYNTICILLYKIYSFWFPKETVQVNSIVLINSNSFPLQKLPLNARAAKSKAGRKPSLTVDYPVAGHYSRHWVAVQGITHRARCARTSKHPCDLPIGRDLSFWDLPYYFIDPIIKTHEFTSRFSFGFFHSFRTLKATILPKKRNNSGSTTA